MLSDHSPGKRQRWPVIGEGAGSRSPFFVLGHPRSGTTLLRSMLSRHPDVFIPPENGALWRMIRVFGGHRSSDWSQVVDSVMTEFEAGYEYEAWGLESSELRERAHGLPVQQRTLQGLVFSVYELYGERFAPGKKVWGDKSTPGSFDYLSKLSLVFPQSSYVHIIRDGRDCVASAMKAGFFDRDISSAARAWRDNVRQCRHFCNRRKRAAACIEFQYETLVSDPAALIPDICAVLNIEPHPAMLDHGGDVAGRLPDVGVLEHHANVARPVFNSSVGKWRKELSAQQCQQIEKVMGSELVRCGYQLESR